MRGADVDGVLITGVYGTGKSSVAAEIAETLERRGVAYGALDLDWLTWFDVPGIDHEAARRVYLENVADVVRNYRSVGVRHVLFAGAVRDRDELRALQAATAMPLRVVRLEVPLDEIARRLQTDPTTGRRDDLQEAARWLSGSVGIGIEDLSIDNQGPIQNVAMQIIEWLGWMP
jgi:tRNA uridine 5-carbamoylmethylation protein Kti12